MAATTSTASANGSILDDPTLSNNPYRQSDHPSWHDAYNAAIALERVDPMRGRMLGYLLLEASLTPDARDHIASKISNCEGSNEKLGSLAQAYIDRFIGYFYRPHLDLGEPEEDSDSEMSDSEYERLKAHARELERLLQSGKKVDPPTNSADAKVQAMYRDNYKCMAAGFHSVHALVDGKVRGVSPDHIQVHGGGILDLTYIMPPVPQSHAYEDEDNDTRALVKSFSGIDVLDEVGGTLVHRLSNLLSLGLDFRSFFQQLELWFEEAPNAPENNSYYVCSVFANPGAIHVGIPSTRLVTFSTSTELELPDPRYLRLHAAVCRIAFKSDADQYLYKIRHDQELERVNRIDRMRGYTT